MFAVRTYMQYASFSVRYTECTDSFDWHGTIHIVTSKLHAVTSLPNTRRHPSSKSDPLPLHSGLLPKPRGSLCHGTKRMREQKICYDLEKMNTTVGTVYNLQDMFRRTYAIFCCRSSLQVEYLQFIGSRYILNTLITTILMKAQCDRRTMRREKETAKNNSIYFDYIFCHAYVIVIT